MQNGREIKKIQYKKKRTKMRDDEEEFIENIISMKTEDKNNLS